MTDCPHSEVTPTISAVTSVMAIQITIFGFKCVECGKQWDIGDACESFVKVSRLEEMYENERNDCLKRQGTIRELRDKIAQLEAALAWYREKAESMKRYGTAKPPKAVSMTAVVTELSLDGGKRALVALGGE